MRFIIVLFCLLIFSGIHAQVEYKPKPPYPNSIIDIGLGVGPVYGVYGGQAVIGYKGCGLLVGVGTVNGLLTRAIGVQLSLNWFYFNVSRAVVGTFNDTEPIIGTVFMFGVKLNLEKSKHLFLNLGGGYSAVSQLVPVGPAYVDASGPAFAGGIGFRIAFKKRKKPSEVSSQQQ